VARGRRIPAAGQWQAAAKPSAETNRQRPHVSVPASANTSGTAIIAERGAGKTTLVADLACQIIRIGFPFQAGFPLVAFDPLGTLTPALLSRMQSFLQGVPPGLHKRFWQRLRIVEVGNPAVITPFPIYYETGGETLREVAERFIDTLRLSHPKLVSQASVTWPSLRRVGINAGRCWQP
jgi:hypothetical protein